MNGQQFSKLFPIGSHLCREPMPPMSELRHDMELLRRGGFQLVKLQENWAADEPLEGACDFSRYEELIDCAARLDMGVYLGMTCEQAPNWLWEKHPGARMVGKNGLPIAYQAQSTNPADGKPGPCYDHDGARADMLRFVGRMVTALGKFENIVVWNTWQEIEYWPERLVGANQEVCFCENTLRFFQSWLMEKYGDLDALNRAWNTRYGAWGLVLPERIIDRKLCLPNDIDWRYFMENIQIGRILRERCAAVRAADPYHRPVFAHVAFPVVGSPSVWTYAKCQDFVGTSSYPLGPIGHRWDDIRNTGAVRFARDDALYQETWDKVLLRLDILRGAHSADQPLWVAELQSGPSCKSLHKGRVPDAADIRRWMLGSVFCGATALAFWVTRSEIMACELNGFSLLDSTGDSTPRFEEACRVGRALGEHPGLFADARIEQAQIAIVIDSDNYYTFASLESGGENFAYSVRGWHKILLEQGILADFLLASDIPALGARYRALILPFPVGLSEQTAGLLCDYAAAGGKVIAEACPGRTNGHGYANRGELSPKMARLFGVYQQSAAIVREPGDAKRWTPDERTWGEFLDSECLRGCGALEGGTMRANYYLETYRCEGASPVLQSSRGVAGTVSADGNAWLIGTAAGHNGTAYCDPDSRRLIGRLLEQCGVTPVHRGRLILRRRIGEHSDALMLFNRTGEPVCEAVDVGPYRSVCDLFGEPVTVRDGAAQVTVEGIAFTVLLCEKGSV